MNQEGSNLNVVRVLSDRYWVDFSGRSDPRGISGSVLFVSGASEESAGPDTSLSAGVVLYHLVLELGNAGQRRLVRVTAELRYAWLSC